MRTLHRHAARLLCQAAQLACLVFMTQCRNTPAPPAAEGVAEARANLDAVAHYIPESASEKNRRPLLLFLHGYGDSGFGVFQTLKLRDLGQRHQIAVVAPDGAMDSNGRRFWNAHRACCNFDQLPIDHVAILSQLRRQLLRDFPLDPAQVYVMGYSNGGFMANRLGCEWGSPIKGIASFAGAGSDRSTCHPLREKLRVLLLHGDADDIVKYEGGTLFDRPDATYGSAQKTFDDWARRLGCEGAPLLGPPRNLFEELDGEETSIQSYEHCARGSVSFWTTRGGSHSFAMQPSTIELAWRELSRER